MRMMAKERRGGVEVATWRDGDRVIELRVVIVLIFVFRYPSASGHPSQRESDEPVVPRPSLDFLTGADNCEEALPSHGQPVNPTNAFFLLFALAY